MNVAALCGLNSHILIERFLRDNDRAGVLGRVADRALQFHRLIE